MIIFVYANAVTLKLGSMVKQTNTLQEIVTLMQTNNHDTQVEAHPSAIFFYMELVTLMQTNNHGEGNNRKGHSIAPKNGISISIKKK